MNYQAINDKLDWLFKEVKDRYARIEKEPNPKFRPLTITAEEFTKSSANVKNSGELFWTALTDIRKIKIYIVFVSHTRTLIALRDAKGLAPLRDEGLLEVELKGESSQDNEGTGEATHYTLGDIKGEKVASYRDTTGVDRPTFERILQQCSRATLAGARDYALLRLLWGNARSAKRNQSVERSRF